ncbi:hypothetical protein [Cellulomonas sp. NS3]|uniref:hypothetical protein n=1 Tax=Cellulomonas sp. NS3 TaxID=2973977 RepID=UPI002162E823|nr:hypothetical protein [Cellulomonas sp. NS3]
MSAPDRFARSAALWLRAYPRRWRTARASELTEVLRDLAAPGAERVDARTALSLVRSGWATRRRSHPPLGAYLRYRLLDRPLPPRWEGWQRDDVHGRLFPVRFALTRTVGIAVLLGLLSLVERGTGWDLVDPRVTVLYLVGFPIALTLLKAITHRRPVPVPERDDLGPFLPYVPLTPEPPRAPRGSRRRRTGRA